MPLVLEKLSIPTKLGKIAVRVGGSGPAILFWPSLLMDGMMWEPQAAHFAPKYKVILIDPPGHGESEALTKTFSFTDCEQVLVDILDALGIDKAHLVGNSWGAMIGGTFAATHPERIGCAMLFNGTASPVGLQQKIEYFALTEIARFQGGIKGMFADKAVQAFIGPTTDRERPQVVKAIRDRLKLIDINSIYWAVKSVVSNRPDQRALFAKIHTPVLVVAGEEDATFPINEVTEMAKSIPNAEFKIMPKTAHLAGLERPQEVIEIIEKFLQEKS